MKRCNWAETNDLLKNYHDKEWGLPVHNDRILFEILSLEGFQSGLSWLTILKKRSHFRKAFANFDVKRVASFTKGEKASLMKNGDIIRNRLKIGSVINNAQAVIEIRKEFGTFSDYVWSFKDPEELSRDLKKRGLKFVGPGNTLSFMKAVGIINGHEKQCGCRKSTAAGGGRP